MPLDDLIRMKDHGVSADHLADMKALGLKDLTLAQIVTLRDHGITPGFVSHAKSRGFNPVDADELIRLKNGGLFRDSRSRTPDPTSGHSIARSTRKLLTARRAFRHSSRTHAPP